MKRSSHILPTTDNVVKVLMRAVTSCTTSGKMMKVLIRMKGSVPVLAGRHDASSAW